MLQEHSQSIGALFILDPRPFGGTHRKTVMCLNPGNGAQGPEDDLRMIFG